MLKIFILVIGGLLMKVEMWGICFLIIISSFILLFAVRLEEVVKIDGHLFFIDTLSFSLIYLSVWLVVFILLARGQINRINIMKILYKQLIVVLLLTLLVRFCINNFLLFYFFFEFSLIPTLLIIMG